MALAFWRNSEVDVEQNPRIRGASKDMMIHPSDYSVTIGEDDATACTFPDRQAVSNLQHCEVYHNAHHL